ncbi:helix-turn-helix domain-containing protein [Granulicoccus phenolivorans]|uniref:helix-turn-helix domain-containing protein n=1 Tax=Granulicoccus phenolivorans TaxID=266854 RepID=UPI000417E4E4|nr:helix-turn-helix domain-containing protein [Granulicoccus phenolivorans]
MNKGDSAEPPGLTPAENTRGIVSPGRMLRTVDLVRYPIPPDSPLAGLVEWIWSVSWSLPVDVRHRQDVVAQPGVNLSLGNPPPPGPAPAPGPYPLRAVVNGVSTDLTTRMLARTGYNIAAKTTTGGFGAFTEDVAALTDRVCDAAEVLPGHRLLELAPPSVRPDRARLRALADAMIAELERLLAVQPAARIARAREVATIARLAETDRSVRRLDTLAALAGVGPRTLQRTFQACAGVSPTWVIRRARVLDAIEAARSGERVEWGRVAADLGYADQAHLTRDVVRALGMSPAAYAAAQRSRPMPGP